MKMDVGKGLKDIVLHSISYAIKSQKDLIFSDFPSDEEVLSFLVNRLEETGSLDFDALIADHINECKRKKEDINIVVEFFIALIERYPKTCRYLLQHKEEFNKGINDTLEMFLTQKEKLK